MTFLILYDKIRTGENEMKNRSELREIIMKVLYQVNILEETNLDYNVNDLIKEQIEIQNEFVNNTINEVISKQKEINDLANKYLKDWTIDRLNKVDQAILSLGIYELVYTDTPSIVAINEAIELSKKYSDEAVTKMLNGVLDSIYHSEENNE